MSTIVRHPALRVTIGSEVVTNCIAARTSHSINVDSNTLDAAIADVDLISPAPGDVGDKVRIEMGADIATLRTCFYGYLTTINRDLYPKQTKLNCKGFLYRAQDYFPPTTDTYDLTNAGVGDTDQNYVSRILTLSGLEEPEYDLDIGGTGATMGCTPAWRQGWRWGARKCGLSMIHKLDEFCLGYRIHDRPNGQIRRSIVHMWPHSSPNPIFTEGVDIYRATLTDTLIDSTDRVVVTGSTGSYEAIGTPSPWCTKFINSPMIEKTEEDDDPSGQALSCEEVADWYLDETNRARRKLVLTTYRDDAIEPNDSIDVVALDRLGINTTLYVNKVDVSINKGHFVQTLDCIGSLA